MREEGVEEEFRITLDEEVSAEMERGIGEKIWHWIERGGNKLLNISVSGLTSIAESMRGRLEEELGGKWSISQITVTVSSKPSMTIVIKRSS